MQQEDKVLEREVGMMACDIFNQLRFERKFCDVLIRVEGAEFPAHKNILCACSTYFMALFTKSWYPQDMFEYSISGISSTIMQLILEYAYTQRVYITEENVRELLIAADYLAVNDLVNECCMYLKARLSVLNCINIWHFAHYYFCEKLKEQAFRFILYNIEEIVCVSEDFLELTVEQLRAIIESDELNVKQENVVFEAILKWIKHAPQKRRAHIEVLLPKVRMALMKPDYFSNNVRNNVFVADNTACKPIIISAMKCIYGLNRNKSLSSELTRRRLPSAVLLAVGGWSGRSATNAIEAYDTRADCWVNVTCPDESPRAYHGTVFLNGFVYCIGGFNGEEYFSSVRRFDPITRTWAQVGSMHFHRGYVSVCVLDGCIYAMGGFDGHERFNTAERYEPEKKQWTMIAPMHTRRSDASATILNGKVYVCGGFDGNECLFTGEYYSPQTGQWTFIPPMSSRRRGLGVIAYNEHVFAVGGLNDFTPLSSAEIYNPQTNSWSLIPKMINPHCNFGIEVLEDLLFVVGGQNNIITTNKVEYYDKRTDEWYEVHDMEINRGAMSCCIISGLPNMAEYSAPRDEVPQSSGSSRGYLPGPAEI